jgi:DNA-directed RNA polymerase subunit RPC12/RpoP
MKTPTIWGPDDVVSRRSGAAYDGERRKGMCIFIAGIQPKTVDVDSQSRMCSTCGLYQARLKRIDHYLSLFFIPLLRVKRGDPFIRCESCGSVFSESGETRFGAPRETESRCSRCGSTLEHSFRFCPRCGNPIP